MKKVLYPRGLAFGLSLSVLRYLCMQAGKAMVRLCGYAGRSKPLLLRDAIRTIISCAGLYCFSFFQQAFFLAFLFYQIKNGRINLFFLQQ